MRFIIRAIDRYVRQRTGVFEFCDDPGCVFRVSIGVSRVPLRVTDGEIPPGTRVLELHFWNENIPPMARTGPTLSWAVKFRRMVASSTRLMAGAMKKDPRLAGVQAVGGVTPLFAPGAGSALERIFIRLGFTIKQHQNPRGRFMEFWEEVYAWFLMWAFANGNHPNLRGLRRSDFWMSTDDFLRLYGGRSERTGVDGSHQGQAAQWWRQP